MKEEELTKNLLDLRKYFFLRRRSKDPDVCEKCGEPLSEKNKGRCAEEKQEELEEINREFLKVAKLLAKEKEKKKKKENEIIVRVLPDHFTR